MVEISGVILFLLPSYLSFPAGSRSGVLPLANGQTKPREADHPVNRGG
jgi:hypothetical protein